MPDSTTAAKDTLYRPETLASLPAPKGGYAVIGFPVAHSLSPAFQRAGLKALGLDVGYEKVEVPPEKLAETVGQFKDLGLAGWNCTLPHKLTMAELVDQRAESAEVLGGVNTVLNDGGRLVGFNTDGDGWVAAIREEFFVDVRDLRIMILGAGGAGQALAIQAALEKCERLVLVNRTYDKVKELKSRLEPLMSTEKLLGAHDRLVAIPWDEEQIASEMEGVDLLVNATSVGLKAYDPPLLAQRLLTPSLMVYDTIYRPERTRLLRDAAGNGARVANGLSMLLHQGAASMALWTGRTPPLVAMRLALQTAAEEAK